MKLTEEQSKLVKELVENIMRQNLYGALFFMTGHESQIQFGNKCIDRINEITKELGIND